MARLQRKIDVTTKSIAEVRELLAVENEDLKQLDDGILDGVAHKLDVYPYHLTSTICNEVFLTNHLFFRIRRGNTTHKQRIFSHEGEKH